MSLLPEDKGCPAPSDELRQTSREMLVNRFFDKNNEAYLKRIKAALGPRVDQAKARLRELTPGVHVAAEQEEFAAMSALIQRAFIVAEHTQPGSTNNIIENGDIAQITDLVISQLQQPEQKRA